MGQLQARLLKIHGGARLMAFYDRMRAVADPSGRQQRGLTGGQARTMTKRSPAVHFGFTRAHELAADGDHDGAATWRRITNAVGQLADNTRPGPAH
jgi:hypothetical protein